MGLQKLRKAIKAKNVDDFEPGTVIAWKSAGRYHYAAIKTPVGWFTTANNNPFTPNVVDYDELIEILARAETTDAQMAGAWLYI